MIYFQRAESLPAEAEELEAILERAAQMALEVGQAEPEAELTLVLTDDAQIHELNRQFLEVDAPTDVLSFPAGEVDPDSDSLYLGDVILSLPRAEAQAQVAGHALEGELSLLVVHGVLHLLGHDHAEPDEKAEMWKLQQEALERLGQPGIAPPLE